MGIDNRRFAVLVRTHFCISTYYVVGKCLKELVARYLRGVVDNGLREKFLVKGKIFLVAMFLENDKVRPCIGSGIIAERVVRQTQRRHKVGTFHHLHSDKRGCGVHYTLRRDKRYQSSLTHRIKGFEKEIVVYRLRCLTVRNILADGIRRVRHGKIAEGNIGGGDIKISVEVAFYLLKTLYPCKDRRMQG